MWAVEGLINTPSHDPQLQLAIVVSYSGANDHY